MRQLNSNWDRNFHRVKVIQVAAAVTEDETETPRRDLCCTVRKVLADFAICD